MLNKIYQGEVMKIKKQNSMAWLTSYKFKLHHNCSV
jgi:hypothetical protein